MKITSLAATAALLTGCAVELPRWHAETVPAVVVYAAPVSGPKSPSCPPIDPAIEVEAKRLTLIGRAREVDGLTAALMGSEAQKNASLARLALAYEACRRTQ